VRACLFIWFDFFPLSLRGVCAPMGCFFGIRCCARSGGK
jgi:hypothetical protein